MKFAIYCLGLVFMFCGSAFAEPRLALVIANGTYSSGMDPLANPVNDGQLLAGTLQKLGFAVTLVIDADQKKMKRAVADFGAALEAAGPTSSALFYYAGHGLQVDGQNYLIPIGADIRREADVDLEAVSAEAVLRQMEFAAPSTSIVILDACRNNPLSRGMRSSTRGLARMDAPNGSYVAYSTAPGQTAADGNGKNSPFATALVAEMVKPGQGIEEAFRNVRINVSRATSGEQTPWDSSSLMSSFYFAGERQVAAIAPEPAPMAPQPAAVTPAPAVPTLDAAEQAFWNSIKDSNRAGDYAAYLKKYPQGTFAELAQSRKDELEAQIASRNVTPPAAPAQPAATPAAIEPEADFESPLADGTIVLSAATAAELNAYLNSIANQGPKTWAYFFVAPNGKAAGSARCKGSGAGNAGADWPTCPAIEDMQKKTRVKAAAQKQCEAKNQGDCVILYYGGQKKAEYKTLP